MRGVERSSSIGGRRAGGDFWSRYSEDTKPVSDKDSLGPDIGRGLLGPLFLLLEIDP